MALLCGAFSFFGVFSKKARLKVERLFLTFSFDRAMIASWQTIVLYFMITGRHVFLVLLLHTISGPSTARTISAPLRRTSRCIQKLAASSPNEAQRSGFGLDQESKEAGGCRFYKKRQPRIHRRANQRSVCAVKVRSSRMSARRVFKKTRRKRYDACDELVEEGGFEPPKRNATDLQSAPFGHSGTPPYEIVELVDGFEPPTC